MTRYLLRMRSRAGEEMRVHSLPLDQPLGGRLESYRSCLSTSYGLHTLLMSLESNTRITTTLKVAREEVMRSKNSSTITEQSKNLLSTIGVSTPSRLKEPSSVEKIMEIDEHIGCAMSGLIADARTLVEHARVETQGNLASGQVRKNMSTRGVNTFSPQGRLFQVDDEEFDIMTAGFDSHRAEDEGRGCFCRRKAYHLTPLGMSLSMVLYTTLSKVMFLIAGHDENGPSLTFWQCNGKAIGSGSEGADSSLQEQYNKDLTLKEAETIALSILKQVMEEKVTPNNVDIAKVAPTYHLYTSAEYLSFDGFTLEIQKSLQGKDPKLFDSFIFIDSRGDTNNVARQLMQLPVECRDVAALTISYEAQARLANPVHGSVSSRVLNSAAIARGVASTLRNRPRRRL
ncbi:proteasome subunit alpha type-5 [Tanacetum coccineum]